jgi:hypothetical protein
MAGAMAAGAGNQQRMATEATGNTMKQQALSSSLQNQQIGYQASGAMNELLGTGMKLQYSPLGTVAGSTSSSTQGSQSSSQNTSQTTGSSAKVGQNETYGGTTSSQETHPSGYGEGMTPWAKGGYVPDELSPTHGNKVDDVPANLNAGEFIIPKDIVEWKGKEFFYKLMAQTRKLRATSDDKGQSAKSPTGYASGGSLGYGAA